MKLQRLLKAAAVVAVAVAPHMAAAGSAPDATIEPAFQEPIPNIPGKSIVAVVVHYPPGGKSPPHRHAPSAFVTGYVLSGAIRSQVNSGKVKVFNVGDSWSETPGAHHDISENESSTEPARLLAIFVVDTNDSNLTVIDGSDKTLPHGDLAPGLSALQSRPRTSVCTPAAERP